MLRAITRRLKHLTTAVLLLLAGVIIAEGVLSFTAPPRQPAVTDRADASLQSMLVPSATTHHELQRLTKYRLDDGSELQINSQGLRGPEQKTPQIPGHVRILLLGDETVLSPHQPDEHTLSHRLKQFLEKATGQSVDVINAGVPGYSPLLSWIQFRQQLEKLSPDIVVLHFDMNDIDDDRVYRRMLQVAGENQICPNALLQNQKVVKNPLLQKLQNSAVVRRVTESAGLPTASVPGLADQYAWTVASGEDLRLVIKHGLRPLQSFGRHAAAAKYKLLVSSVPVPWQVTSADNFPSLKKALGTQATWPEKHDRPFQILKAACDQQSIIFSDATDAFRDFSQPAKLYQPDSQQLSTYGNALYARSISSTLLETPDLASVFSSRNRVSAEKTDLH